MSELLPLSTETASNATATDCPSAPVAPLQHCYGPGSGHVLARIEYGEIANVLGDAVQVPLRPLGDSPSHEQWLVPSVPQRETLSGFRVSRADDLMFGAAVVEGEDLERAALEIYGNLLSLCTQSEMQLARIWNSMPNVHGGPATLNRYMRFCKGRADAFEKHFGSGFEGMLPACSAVGSHTGALVVYFLAASSPSTYLENPRQQSAYHYPRRYGPRSPSFARATRAPHVAGEGLMISGTASIVGHASLHAGDVALQTEETLRNMRVLVHGSEDKRLGDSMVTTKAYVRHPDHLETVRDLLDTELGPHAQVLYLLADICRPELLVEIEGLAKPSAVPPAGQ